MTLRIRIFGSGSTGNAALYSAGESHVLVDCGLSARKLSGFLRREGVEPHELSAVFVTHEHSDHVSGLRVFLKKLKVPLFAAPECLETEGFWDVEPWHVEPLEGAKAVPLGALTVTPFPVPHDAAKCFGFVLQAGGVKAVHATDFGAPTPLVRERLKGAHCLLLEFNHDLERLLTGSYPLHVKMRVKGRLGHLSNEQAGALAAEAVDGETRAVFLMHLSRENNLPQLALLAAKEALIERKVRLEVARAFEPTPGWEG